MKINDCVFYERVKRPIKYCFDKYFNPIYVGLENIPEKPYILAGNHHSFLDAFLLMSGIDDPISFAANENLFNNIFMSKFLHGMRVLSIDYGSTNLSSIREAILAKEDKKVVGIFPEGKINKTDELGTFRSEVEILALLTNVPVVPFGINGRYSYKSNVHLNIGEPIETAELKSHLEIVHEKVKELMRR